MLYRPIKTPMVTTIDNSQKLFSIDVNEQTLHQHYFTQLTWTLEIIERFEDSVKIQVPTSWVDSSTQKLKKDFKNYIASWDPRPPLQQFLYPKELEAGMLFPDGYAFSWLNSASASMMAVPIDQEQMTDLRDALILMGKTKNNPPLPWFKFLCSAEQNKLVQSRITDYNNFSSTAAQVCQGILHNRHQREDTGRLFKNFFATFFAIVVIFGIVSKPELTQSLHPYVLFAASGLMALAFTSNRKDSRKPYFGRANFERRVSLLTQIKTGFGLVRSYAVIQGLVLSSFIQAPRADRFAVMYRLPMSSWLRHALSSDYTICALIVWSHHLYARYNNNQYAKHATWTQLNYLLAMTFVANAYQVASIDKYAGFNMVLQLGALIPTVVIAFEQAHRMAPKTLQQMNFYFNFINVVGMITPLIQTSHQAATMASADLCDPPYSGPLLHGWTKRLLDALEPSPPKKTSKFDVNVQQKELTNYICEWLPNKSHFHETLKLRRILNQSNSSDSSTLKAAPVLEELFNQVFGPHIQLVLAALSKIETADLVKELKGNASDLILDYYDDLLVYVLIYLSFSKGIVLKTMPSKESFTSYYAYTGIAQLFGTLMDDFYPYKSESYFNVLVGYAQNRLDTNIRQWGDVKYFLDTYLPAQAQQPANVGNDVQQLNQAQQPANVGNDVQQLNQVKINLMRLFALHARRQQPMTYQKFTEFLENIKSLPSSFSQDRSKAIFTQLVDLARGEPRQWKNYWYALSQIPQLIPNDYGVLNRLALGGELKHEDFIGYSCHALKPLLFWDFENCQFADSMLRFNDRNLAFILKIAELSQWVEAEDITALKSLTPQSSMWDKEFNGKQYRYSSDHNDQSQANDIIEKFNVSDWLKQLLRSVVASNSDELSSPDAEVGRVFHELDRYGQMLKSLGLVDPFSMTPENWATTDEALLCVLDPDYSENIEKSLKRVVDSFAGVKITSPQEPDGHSPSETKQSYSDYCFGSDSDSESDVENARNDDANYAEACLQQHSTISQPETEQDDDSDDENGSGNDDASNAEVSPQQGLVNIASNADEHLRSSTMGVNRESGPNRYSSQPVPQSMLCKLLRWLPGFDRYMQRAAEQVDARCLCVPVSAAMLEAPSKSAARIYQTVVNTSSAVLAELNCCGKRQHPHND